MQDLSRGIRRVAVLGAGVMGAQVAAHLANAGVAVELFELPGAEDPNANVNKALAGLRKLKPSPLGSAGLLGRIRAGNYDQHLDRLADCELVIEAITERLDWKHDLYAKVLPHLADDAILASNTSGISIDQLAAKLPAEVQERFCGAHFFNPPRYMYLLELIPHPKTRPGVLDTLEAFFTTSLGKGVIRAKDTPSFIANRVGIFSMMAVIHHADRLGLPFDLVDKLTGPGIGHPKSATFRTADVVGLDTFAHVVSHLGSSLPDDPWNPYYRVPGWAGQLIEEGALGQKSGRGIYRKSGREIQVLEPDSMAYRRVQSGLVDEVRAILKERDPARKFDLLRGCDHPQAEFLRSIFRDLFHYSAVHLGEIAHCARDVDLALRWGFGWQLGPFETWQAAGWRKIAEELQQDIEQGRSMSDAPLPDWVLEPGREGVQDQAGSWSAADGRSLARSTQAVYARQMWPDRVVGEPEPELPTVFETADVVCRDIGDEVVALSFKTRMHAIGIGVLDGVREALVRAEDNYKALILWQDQPPFSVGANLKDAMGAAESGDFNEVTRMVMEFQQTAQMLRYANVPTVAAVQGLVLGGGCEFMLHCDRAVAALESYIGLPEVGVGLIPAAGGSKEMALRAARMAAGGDVFPHLARHFEILGMGKVATSALEAREYGFLREHDPVVLNPAELLHVAKHNALALYEGGYRPPLPQTVRVAGRDGVATIQAQLVNMREGGFISEHDYLIGERLANVMCGGDLDPGTEVDENWILRMEIEAFMGLAMEPKTQERIFYMLENGKPLRN